MRSTNINFKRGILFFVYDAMCLLENVRRSTRVFSVWNLFSNCLLFCLGSSSGTANISADWPEGEGKRERKGERREERRVRGDGFWDSIPWPRWK